MSGGHAPLGEPVLLVSILATAALVTLPLAGTAAVAYYRRRSRTYLLVALALFALVARIGVAAGTVAGIVPQGVHHLAEHGLDVTIAALLVGAVILARGIDHRPSSDRE